MSVNSARSTSGRRISATPVITECVRPESFSSIWRASSVVRGFPNIAPARVTTVSAAMTIAGPTARAATSSALANASRCTISFGDSPGTGVSSTAEDKTVKGNPAERKISARRTEPEARISFMAEPLPQEYYRWNLRGWTRLKNLKYDGFLVFAKNAAQRVRDECDSGVGFACTKDSQMEILESGRTARQLANGGECL